MGCGAYARGIAMGAGGGCVTWCCMKNLNVRIPDELRRELDRLSAEQRRPASDLVRESVRRYRIAERLAALRRKTLLLAEAQGFLTDEDVFKAVS